MKKLKILIVNDDGIKADGINILAEALARVSEVTVVAPDRERSAASHSISVHSPLTYKRDDYKTGITAYAVSGTPADCVKFALNHIACEADLVISGINRGSNIGTDIMYSGTVSAALQAAYQGKRAIAVSQCDFNGGKTYYEGAARFVVNNLDKLYNMLTHDNAIININYPIKKYEEVSGVRLCHMGLQMYADRYVIDKNNEDSFWLTGIDYPHNKNKSGSDVEAVKNGFITVTPISFDMTDYNTLEEYKKTGVDFKL